MTPEVLLSEQARDALASLEDREQDRVIQILETGLVDLEAGGQRFDVDGRTYVRSSITRGLTIVFRRLDASADGVSGYLVASLRPTDRP